MQKIFYFLTIFMSFVFLFNACGGNAENLNESNPAPDFSLQDAYGNSYTLSEFRGTPVVLYFYPKANTSGCTKQACGIRDNREKFSNAGIKVFGISVDSKESLLNFINEHQLNFPLLSDEQKEVSTAYGVLNNLGFASRITFIIDKNGIIAKVIRDIDIEKHADDVFEFASGLL
jgi:thioredoxin-dependent peroxiredoxin